MESVPGAAGWGAAGCGSNEVRWAQALAGQEAVKAQKAAGDFVFLFAGEAYPLVSAGCRQRKRGH